MTARTTKTNQRGKETETPGAFHRGFSQTQPYENRLLRQECLRPRSRREKASPPAKRRRGGNERHVHCTLSVEGVGLPACGCRNIAVPFTASLPDSSACLLGMSHGEQAQAQAETRTGALFGSRLALHRCTPVFSPPLFSLVPPNQGPIRTSLAYPISVDGGETSLPAFIPLSVSLCRLAFLHLA